VSKKKQDGFVTDGVDSMGFVELSNKVLIIKAEGVEEEQQIALTDAIHMMGANGALVIGPTDTVEAIDVTDRLVILIGENLTESIMVKAQQAVKASGGIGIIGLPNMYRLLTLTDEELARFGLQRIIRRSDA
jgi:4-hydroxy-3-methylbut-2-enyl diphosphate reductase IspH